MKRFFLFLGLSLLFLTVTVASSYAYYFGYEDFSGTYIYGKQGSGQPDDPAQGDYLGTVYSDDLGNANDSEAILLDFLIHFACLDVTSVDIVSKSEPEQDLVMLYTPLLETNGEGEIISGTWQTYDGDRPSDPDVVDLIIVKGGSSFSVHRYDPAASNGEWNVGYLDEVGKKALNIPSLSHVSAYISEAPQTPVPEPATMLLFGSGLIGLAGVSRKKFLKKN